MGTSFVSGGLRVLRQFCSALNHSLEPFYRYGAKLLVHVMYRARFSGFENIPETGAAILIANHVSYVDGLVINAACKRPVRFIIDEEIYQLPGVNYFMRLNKAIPIAPNKTSVKLALSLVSDALRDGDLVCVFPEGQLTYTGNMTHFRFGIEWMVKNDPVPVIPIALKGLWGSVFSRKYLRSRFPWVPRSFRRKVSAVCGAPIPPEEAKISHMQRVIMKLKSSIVH